MEDPLDEPWDVEWDEWNGRPFLRITRNEAANPINPIGGTPTCMGVKARRWIATKQAKRMSDGELRFYWRCSYEFRFQGA